MQSFGLLRAAIVFAMYDFLRRTGAPADRFLESARLPRDLTQDDERLVPHRFVARLLEDAARAEGVETFGLQMGLAARVDAFGSVGRKLYGASSVYDALTVIERIGPNLHTGERYWLAVVDGEVRLHHRFHRTLAGAGSQAELYALGCVLSFLRSAAGPSWRPPRIHVQQGTPRHIRDLEVVAGTDLVFDQGVTAVVIPRAILALPLRRPGLDTPMPAEDAAAPGRAAPEPARALPQALRQLLIPLLRQPDLDLPAVAAATGLSTRTLQRRLEIAGTSYARVLADARAERAQRLLLESPDLPVARIGREVGYDDPAHFTRAFRRWTGVTPGGFRRERDATRVAARALA